MNEGIPKQIPPSPEGVEESFPRPSSESTEKTVNPISLLAQEILNKEGDNACPELKELVNLFEKKHNSNDLNLLKVYLGHLHSLEGSDNIVKFLWKMILVNEQGQSILPLLYSSVMLHINPRTVPYLKDLVQDPELMHLWLQFSFASPRYLDMSKIPPDWIKKFLESPLGKVHRVSYSFKDNHTNIDLNGDYIQIISLDTNVTSYSFKYAKSIDILFQDLELFKLCTEFSNQFPSSTSFLLEALKNQPQELKAALLKASESPEIGQLIANLQNPIDLIVYNQLLSHPNINREIVSYLIPMIATSPVHTGLIIALMLYELEHTSLNGLTKRLLNCDGSKNGGTLISVMDFLHPFLVQNQFHFHDDTTLETLMELIEKRPEIVSFLDRLIDFDTKFSEQALHQLKDLNQKDPSICLRLFRGNYDLVFTFALAGLLRKQPVDAHKMTILLDWIDGHPDDYAALSQVVNFWPSDLHLSGTFNQMHEGVWLAIAHLPEKVHLAIEESYGISISFMNLIFFELYQNAHTAQLMNESTSDAVAETKGEAKAEIKEVLDFTHLFKKKPNLHRRLLRSTSLSVAEKRQLVLLLSHDHLMLCRKILKLYQNQSELAKKLLHLATVNYETALTIQVLSYMTAHPQASLSKLYQKALDANDIQVLKALAALEKKISAISNTPGKMRKLFDHWESLTAKEAFQEITNFVYGQSDRLEEKASLQESVGDLPDIKACTKDVGAFSSLADVQQKMSAFRIVKTIIDQIVSPEGRILLHQIDPLLIELSEPLPISPQYVLQLTNVLKALKDNPKMVHALEALKIPDKLDPSAAFLLRASEGLPFDAPISLNTLQKTVLTTLALHTRQLPQVGSCVGSSLLNALLDDQEQALTFIAKVLIDGKIEVEHQYQTFDIHFTPRPNDSILKPQILMTSEGMLTQKGEPPSVSIAQHPGILKIAEFLKIPEELREQWLQDAMALPEINILHVDNTYLLVDPASLIKALALTAKNLQPVIAYPENLSALCEVLYLSSFDNLTSRILEGIMLSVDINQIYSLSEAFTLLLSSMDPSKLSDIPPMDCEKPISILLHQIQNGKDSPCAYPDSLLKAIFSNETKETSFLWKRVVTTLKKQFARDLDVIFDPSLGRKILIDRSIVQEVPTEAIDSSEKFSEVCVKIGQKATESIDRYLSEHPELSNTNRWWEETSRELKNYLGSNQFLNAYTLLYSEIPRDLPPSERKNLSTLLNLAPLDHQASYEQLPWHFIPGANKENALTLLHPLKKNSKLKFLSYCCKNASDLRDYLVLLTKHIDFTQESLQYLAGNIPTHSVNFSFKHKVIRNFIEAENKEEWLQNNCINTAHEVSDKLEISPSARQEICQTLEASLPISVREKWKEMTANNNESHVTLTMLRKELMETLSLCLGTKNSALSPAFNELDMLLFSRMPTEERRKCKLLTFIDTNWYDEDDHADLFFALFFSPISLQWELWKVDESHYIEKVDDKKFFTPNVPYKIYYTA